MALSSECKKNGRGGGVLVKGLNLGYHNKETMLFAIDPYYGDLIQSP